MRDFRDSKAMAQTLREALTAKAVTISHSESLELVSKMLGLADWNTLSARIQAAQPAHEASATAYPVVPMRDFVAFPAAHSTLFVGRPRTMQALDQAFEQGRREVVLVAQKDPAADQPGGDDLFRIGVLGRLMEVLKLPPPGGTQDGRGESMKILVYGQRRVGIRRVTADTGSLLAEIADIHEGAFPEATALVRQVHERFETYAGMRKLALPEGWPRLGQIGDPGRLADLVAQQLPMTVQAKQALLEMLDPVQRLDQVAGLLEQETEAA